MSKIKYFKISKNIKIRYLSNNLKKNPYIIFLHGFMSDIDGEKPKVLSKFCNKLKLGFFAIEYSGHGKSSGKFTDGNISKWRRQVSFFIKRKIKNNKFILIGSSMGAWLSTLQFKYFEKQIEGFIGIGSAPEFLDRVMWKKFSNKMRNETKKKGIYYLKHGGYEYPITYQLIKDGRKNKILNKTISSKIPVTLLHGTKDEAIPLKFSKKLLKIFTKGKRKLIAVKKGDHSLFSKKNQKIILRELENLIN